MDEKKRLGENVIIHSNTAQSLHSSIVEKLKKHNHDYLKKPFMDLPSEILDCSATINNASSSVIIPKNSKRFSPAYWDKWNENLVILERKSKSLKTKRDKLKNKTEI